MNFIKNKFNYLTLISFVIPLIVSVSLCIVETFQIESYVNDSIESSIHPTFASFTGDLHSYEHLRKEWRPRILSNFLAGRVINLLDAKIDFSLIVGIWTSAWLFLIFLLLLIEFHEKALFFIIGLFGGIAYGYTKSVGIAWVFPWDMPSLFVYVVFLILVKNKKYNLLIPFIPLAMLFKETAIVMVVAFLFMDDTPFKRRIIYLIFTLSLCFLLKMGVDIATHNPSLFLTMTWKKNGTTLRSLLNLKILFDINLDNPFLINSGLLLSMLIVPVKTRTIQMFKIIALIFLVSNFVFGIINEYRIWFELIPLSLFALQITFFPDIDNQKVRAIESSKLA